MFSVLLIFLYLLLTTYFIGFLVLRGIIPLCIGKHDSCNYYGKNYCMAGLVVLTVYAQIFSLFYKVGLVANIILILLCVTTVVIFRKELFEDFSLLKEKITKGRATYTVLLLFLFILFAYGTSRGYIHYDTGLYHAQSIRWIEEYGVVRGLGNLHCRLAYNSSSFSLSALFSFSFLGTQSYHCVAGFLAFLLAKVCSEIGKKLLLSNFVRIVCIYYLFSIFNGMISPTSDYFMVLTVFYIVIRYLDLLESKEESWIPYACLSLVAVYTISLKLSAALIILLAIKPAVMLIKERNLRGVFSFLGLGILIIAPYLIRNVIISGWLVYPFTSIDLFAVDWKIPAGIAEYDAREIQVWGRGIHEVGRYEEPITIWFPEWLGGLRRIEQLFIFTAIFAVFIWILVGLYLLYKKKKDMYEWLLLATTVNVSFIFWLFSAPLFRYGCVYVWLAAVVTLGGLFLYTVGSREILKKVCYPIVYVVIGILACYKLFSFCRETVTAYESNYLIHQKDYENFETMSYEIQGISFYYPTEGDRTGYEAFPASPVKSEIILRGKDLKDGFRHNNF